MSRGFGVVSIRFSLQSVTSRMIAIGTLQDPISVLSRYFANYQHRTDVTFFFMPHWTASNYSAK